MATSVYEIPVTPGAAQTFSTTIISVSYNMRLVWNSKSNCWVLDIADQNDVPIVQGIPLVTGIDLLGQYEYLGFGGQMICLTDTNPDLVPTYQNLGDSSHLYFLITTP